MSWVNYILPLLVGVLILYAALKKVPVFDCFLEGARENLSLSISLLPTLFALLLMIGLLRESGAITLLTEWISPSLTRLGFPSECIPLALLRPVSGSGSLAVYSSVLEEYGADSFAGTVASILQGASETTFYTIALYYGAAQIRNGRCTLFCALSGDCTVFLLSTLLVRLTGA
ncbi:MAG: spore maturation protein [Ruminococcus sp.]|nr:spore maturation protein [Ruminococcus sp.]